jgi:DNA modification methylase
MRRLPAFSVDAIITSPPYPGIKRDYGFWGERHWLAWMQGVVKASDRLLKPSGSMVFVIGPTFRHAGSLASWPYEFVLSIFGMGLNVIQDAYWVKACRMPMGQVRRGLMRDAVEWCVWVGPPDCYKDQKAILWEYSESMKRLIDLARRGRVSNVRHVSPSGASANEASFAVDRGGATPMNAIVTANAGQETLGHPAAFPEPLAAYWIKYLTPPGGVVLDPFAGSGTTLAAAKRAGRHWIGIERMPQYARIARRRLSMTHGPR